MYVAYSCKMNVKECKFLLGGVADAVNSRQDKIKTQTILFIQRALAI